MTICIQTCKIEKARELIKLTLLSLGDMPAGEGFSAVAVSALGAFGALALIFAVLVIMNKIHEKKNPNEQEQDERNDESEKDE